MIQLIRSDMKIRRVAIFAGATLLAAFTASGCANTQDAVSEKSMAASSASSGDQPLEVIYTGTLPFTQALVQETASDPAQRSMAIGLVEGWSSSNGPVTVPGPDANKPRTLTAAEISALLTELKTPGAGSLAATPSYSGSPVVGVSTGVDPTNPLTFPVIGHAGSGNSFWTGMDLFVARAICDHQQCHDTDRYTSVVTINPGPTTSRVNSSNRYFPSSGYFGNKHLQMWALTDGHIEGVANTGQLPAAGVDYVSYPSRKGHGLQEAITLWVYLNPKGSYAAHSGKTTQGKCGTGDDHICRY